MGEIMHYFKYFNEKFNCILGPHNYITQIALYIWEQKLHLSIYLIFT